MGQTVASALRDLRCTVGFFTRLPVGAAAAGGGGLRRATAWVPVVGALVGALMAAVHWCAGLVLDGGPATLLAIFAAILITGGLHEDGLADTADALGAHAGRERRLEILRDPRIGTFGGLAVAFLVVFPLLVLAPLDDADFARAAICGHVLGRWSTAPLSWLLGAARPESSSTLLHGSGLATLASSAITLAIVLPLAGAGPGALAAGVALTLTALTGVVLHRVFGGTTGDGLGAGCKLVELGVYAAVAA